MPKKECSKVFGHAPRKALAVKKAIKQDSGKAKAKKGAGNAKAPKKTAPATLEVFGPDEHVSASTMPTSPSHSPSYPASPTYERESWWDSFGELSQRIDDASAAIKDLKERVKGLEEEHKDRAAGSVFGKRD
jgi:hypothetical protein